MRRLRRAAFKLAFFRQTQNEPAQVLPGFCDGRIDGMDP
jgi:hypothetical protein